MRTSLIVVAAAAVLAGGAYALQTDEPPLTATGPRVKAALAAEWPTAAPARAPAFSRDGKLLALSDATGAIVIRDTASWKAVRRLTHPGGATSVLFTKAGGSLISTGYDGSIRFWDLATGKQTGIINGSAKPIWTLDLSPDGSRLAAAGEDNIIRIWDLRAPLNPLELRGHGRNVWEVRFSPDGKRLASGSFDRSVRLWDATTGAQLKMLNGHTQAVVGLDYSPDGKLLVSGGDDSSIRYWRAADGAPLRNLDNGHHVDKVAFSPDGRWLASGGHPHGLVGELWHQLTGSGGSGPAVHIWRTADDAAVAKLPHPDDVYWVSFSRDGQWLVTSGEDSRFRLWRLTAKAA